jgi:hypothetical protein
VVLKLLTKSFSNGKVLGKEPPSQPPPVSADCAVLSHMVFFQQTFIVHALGASLALRAQSLSKETTSGSQTYSEENGVTDSVLPGMLEGDSALESRDTGHTEESRVPEMEGPGAACLGQLRYAS